MGTSVMGFETRGGRRLRVFLVFKKVLAIRIWGLSEPMCDVRRLGHGQDFRMLYGDQLLQVGLSQV